MIPYRRKQVTCTLCWVNVRSRFYLHLKRVRMSVPLWSISSLRKESGVLQRKATFLPREMVNTLSSETFKGRLDRDLSNLVELQVYCREVGLGDI